MRIFEILNIQHLVIYLFPTLAFILIFAAGLEFLLLSFIIYAPATILFSMARREQGRRVFSPRELLIFAGSIAGAVIGVIALAAGWVQL